LVQGRSIRIAFAGPRTDRYGRLLIHAFVGDDSGPGGRQWVQGEMLKAGMARAYSLDGNSRCVAELIAHEAVASEAATGLWAEAAYAVRSSEDVSALLRLAGPLPVVGGTVLPVSGGRGPVYLNFGEDRRQDFTIMMRGPANRSMAAAGLAAQTLSSRKIRVRGWVERRGGPLIEVHHPAAIEVLRASDDANEAASEPPGAVGR